jgi:hypothetical protein
MTHVTEMAVEYKAEHFVDDKKPYRHACDGYHAGSGILPGTYEVVTEIVSEPLEIEYVTHG